MRKVKAGKVETTELAAKYVHQIDAADCWEVPLWPGETRDPLELTRKSLTASPKWVESLMNLRNMLVRPLGLATVKEGPTSGELRFPLLAATEEEIILGLDDSHLSFWVSGKVIEIVDKPGEAKFVMTTYVHINNWLGRFYWSIVKHFHPRVVKAGMRLL